MLSGLRLIVRVEEQQFTQLEINMSRHLNGGLKFQGSLKF